MILTLSGPVGADNVDPWRTITDSFAMAVTAEAAATPALQVRSLYRFYRAGEEAYPRQLSGGELARAGLAIALANNPTVLIADEPTGEGDSATEFRPLDLLIAAAGRGKACLRQPQCRRRRRRDTGCPP